MSKKVFGILLLSAFVISAFYLIRTVWAAEDSFQITISVAYISISLKDWQGNDYATWAIGTVNPGSISTMEANSGGSTEEGIDVSIEANVTMDIYCYATNTQGWTLSTTPGNKQYVLRIGDFLSWQPTGYPDMSGAATITAESSPGTRVVENVPPSTTHRYSYFDLTAPTTVDSAAQNTITVTINVQAY